jgi:hypothetical protein
MKVHSVGAYVAMDGYIYKVLEHSNSTDLMSLVKVKCISALEQTSINDDVVGEVYFIMNLVLGTLGNQVPTIKGVLYE